MNEQSVRCLEMIANSAMRAGELTRKLLTFSRKSLKSYEPVDLYMIILDTVELIKKSLNKDIVIRLESEVENPVINGNFSFLQNAFLNIGLNAVYAMPEGGVLTLSLESVFLDDVYCEASHFNIKEGGYAKVSICDTGCGISRENLKRVFEPFFTTKERGVGTGLGLAAVYGTVQDHEGAVTVYSEEGQGTVFHIYLPLISFDKSRVNRKESFHEGSGTILLADDEKYITQTTKEILERIGYSVIVGEDGEQGISLFDEFRDSIVLVILDMVMPLTEGGEVYRHIRESSPLLPVVVASGFYKKAESLNAEGDEKMRFLQKPFLPHDLLGTIDELLY